MPATCNDFVVRWFSSIFFCVLVFVRSCAEGVLVSISKAWELWCCRADFGLSILFPAKVPEAFPNVLGLSKEAKGYSSPCDLFELVAEDILTLNKNLQSIPGTENRILISVAEHIFGAGGKRLRPALVFLASRATAEIAGSKDITKEQRRLAEIIEMIHTATLIHDDIIDESDMRRGRETVHKLFGTRVAVLAGDYMFAQSTLHLVKLGNIDIIKLLARLSCLSELALQVIGDLVSGEMKQACTLFDCDIRLDDYLLKSYNKTASLLAASTKGAAMLSCGVSTDITEQMYQYGKNLGLSFQIVDDILDFTQSAELLGKPTGSDLATGNLTAPVIFALEKERRLRDIIESKFNETDSLHEAVDIVKISGGIDRARDLAREIADRAVEGLHCLPTSPFRIALERIVKYNLERVN